jgi:Tol biopolymer transport system component/tRNA A-37 threonylcarbamoyl transferase component Bud32
MTGQRLLHYEIIEKLGEGGMGVVYKARDTHLDRFVAVKVLPPERTADEARKARFAREARAASALNHPNIVTVHDISRDGERDFIVMEFVAGKTLDQLIGRKGLKLSEALKLGARIADALAAAHAAGIVHRDLKPANVMVSDNGAVKVLDFGLAKLTESATESDEDAPTRTVRAQTEEGAVVGTAAYMSPEQAEGRKVDSRSDIFSFGAVLYEMITGRRAFQGASTAATLSAILDKDPAPIGTIVANVPPELEKLLGRCLSKALERRAQHIDDIRIQLEALREETESGVSVQRPARRFQWRRPLAAAVLLVVGAMALGFWLGRSREPGPVILRRLTSDAGLSIDPALSPDGKLLAYASDRAGEHNLDIWVQQVAGGEPVRLTRDAADEHQPAFSPDGTKIAYRSERDGGGIYVIPALGGEPRLLAAQGQWPRYSPDGTRIAYAGSSSVFRSAYVVNSAGGSPEQLSAIRGPLRPIWSPDGSRLLLRGSDFSQSFSQSDDWWVVPVEAGRSGKPIQTNARSVLARYSLSEPEPFQWAGNRILFTARFGGTSNIWQVSISPRTFQLAGVPRRLTAGTEDETQPTISSASGAAELLLFATRAFTVDLWMERLDAVRAEADGEPSRLTADVSTEALPTVSADGAKVVFVSNRTGNDDVWLKDLVSGKELALTATPWQEQFPVINRRGSHVVYQSRRDGKTGIHVVSAAGGISEKVCDDCGAPTDLSNDGLRILLQYRFNDPRSTLGVLDRQSGAKYETLTHPRYSLYRAHFSPDERWVAFHADDPGRGTRVFIAPYRTTPTAESEWIAVTDGAVFDDAPRWSPDGNLLYYVSDADGFRCIWARRLDPVTKQPAGAPFPVKHVHGRQRSIAGVDVSAFDLAVARDKLVFNMGEIRGNIWMAELKSARQRSDTSSMP